MNVMYKVKEYVSMLMLEYDWKKNSCEKKRKIKEERKVFFMINM